MSLPNGYLQLEYIESTGTQWIDTGISGKHKFIHDIEFTDNSRNLMGFSIYTPYYWGANNNSRYEMSNYINLETNIRRNVEYDLTTNNTILKVDNQTILNAGINPSSNYTIFRINGGNYYAKAKLYEMTIYDTNDILVRDFIPAMRLSDNVVGLYDQANDVFYTNQGTGTFLYPAHKVSVNINPSKAIGKVKIEGEGYYDNAHLLAIKKYPYKFLNWTLPYTRLEYIESTGTQYIDTGYIPKGSVKINFETMLPNVERLSFFGEYTNGDYDNFQLICVNNRWGIRLPNISTEFGTIQGNTKYNVEFSKTQLKVNDNIIGTYSSENINGKGKNLLLFCRNQNGTPALFMKGKIYKLQIYENDVNKYNFIPVIRHSDGAIGLLDLVNLKFYGNSGTGVFIGGNVVGGNDL